MGGERSNNIWLVFIDNLRCCCYSFCCCLLLLPLVAASCCCLSFLPLLVASCCCCSCSIIKNQLGSFIAFLCSSQLTWQPNENVHSTQTDNWHYDWIAYGLPTISLPPSPHPCIPYAFASLESLFDVVVVVVLGSVDVFSSSRASFYYDYWPVCCVCSECFMEIVFRPISFHSCTDKKCV